MQVSVESGEGLQRRMTVEVPVDQVNQAVESRLKSLARTVRLDGFRPGKVPLKVVRQRFGERARQEAYGELIQSTFQEAAVEQNLRPAGEPSIELKEKDETFGYVAEFEVMPEITLADMKETSVERPVAEVTEADVDAMLDKLRRQRTTWNTVDRAARDGDRVTVSFVGKIDGEPFEGGSAERVPLVLGSGAMIEGFEQGLLGAAAGDGRSLELQFPEDYRVESLAGKPVVFEITIDEIQEPLLPAIDADFARALGVADGSVDNLRREVRGNMERELRQKVRAGLKQRVMDLLVDSHDLTVPRVMVDSEAARLKEQAREEMARRGQASGVDLPLDVFREDAARRVKLGLLIAEVVKANGIRVDESRMRQLAEEYATAYEDPAEVVNFYLSDRNARSSLENLALEEQVVDWVLGQARVEDKQTTFDEAM
jgi:trigger factor